VYGWNDVAPPDVAAINSHIQRADFVLVTHHITTTSSMFLTSRAKLARRGGIWRWAQVAAVGCTRAREGLEFVGTAGLIVPVWKSLVSNRARWRVSMENRTNLIRIFAEAVRSGIIISADEPTLSSANRGGPRIAAYVAKVVG